MFWDPFCNLGGGGGGPVSFQALIGVTDWVGGWARKLASVCVIVNKKRVKRAKRAPARREAAHNLRLITFQLIAKYYL